MVAAGVASVASAEAAVDVDLDVTVAVVLHGGKAAGAEFVVPFLRRAVQLAPPAGDLPGHLMGAGKAYTRRITGHSVVARIGQQPGSIEPQGHRPGLAVNRGATAVVLKGVLPARPKGQPLPAPYRRIDGEHVSLRHSQPEAAYPLRHVAGGTLRWTRALRALLRRGLGKDLRAREGHGSRQEANERRRASPPGMILPTARLHDDAASRHPAFRLP